MGTSVTVLFLASRAELSNGQATPSIRAAVLCTVRAPHCDGKGMASTAASLAKGLFHHLLSTPPDLWRCGREESSNVMLTSALH